MVSEHELETLMRGVREGTCKELEFLQALLDAIVYVLAPVHDDCPNPRFCMLKRPDGMYFIPSFTSRAQAEEACGDGWDVVGAAGRLFFEATRGATIIVNPNHEHFTLYPEEIAGFLRDGTLPTVNCDSVRGPTDILIGPPHAPPEWLLSDLKAAYPSLPYVRAAWLLESRPRERPEEMTYVVILDVVSPHEEQAARATIVAMQAKCVRHDLELDVMVPKPSNLDQFSSRGLLIYERDASAPYDSEIAPGIPRKRAPLSSEE